MARRMLTVVLALGAMGIASCTSVQKGSAAGGAIGGAAGAGIGHYATGLGGVPGGIMGLGLGAAAGAIASESVYGPEETGEDVAAGEQIQELASELEAKDSELQKLKVALQKEEAQQKALLEAYEKARTDPAALQTVMPAGVEVSSDAGKVTFSILSEVLFQSGKTELTAAGKKALRETAAVIRKQYPDASVEVRGHTDNVPIRYSPYKSNWELSCSRALTVVHHLIESESFKANRLAAVGCGETQPVATNSTAQGRRKNRRAELVVLMQGMRVAETKPSR
jgi:flagellar motor protein MotB